MSTEEAYHLLLSLQPPTLYLSGKTSTGKSTFAKSLHNDLGYKVIQLDQLVHDSVIKPLGLTDRGQVFVEVYKHRTKTDWIERFVEGTRQAVTQDLAAGQRLVLEGAVANPFTLTQILQAMPGGLFFYFHPKNLKVYERNLTSRFMETTKDHEAGLPARFWKLVDPAVFSQFCKDRQLTPTLAQAIHTYAQSSQAESKARLAAFRNQFDNIHVIEI
jgi:hypothetical protein